MMKPRALTMKDKIVKVSGSNPKQKMRYRHRQPLGMSELHHYSIRPTEKTVQEQEFANYLDNNNTLGRDSFHV
jgi:hypothetical protein